MPERESSGGARETHVRHTRAQELYQRERELLREKVEAWLRGEIRESRTSWIGMRVTPTIKDLYSRAPEHVKLAARRAFEAVIISWFLGGDQVQYQGVQQPMIFNLNINVNENKVNVNIDRIRDLVERLWELRMPLPPKQRELVEELRRIVYSN